MAKKKSNAVIKNSDPSQTEKVSRDELMSRPGWSNTAPGSPAATPIKSRVMPDEKINTPRD